MLKGQGLPSSGFKAVKLECSKARKPLRFKAYLFLASLPRPLSISYVYPVKFFQRKTNEADFSTNLCGGLNRGNMR